MHRSLTTLCLSALLLFAGCNPRDATAPVAKADGAASDSGGSLKGDFGPPQGEPIKAVLTARRWCRRPPDAARRRR